MCQRKRDALPLIPDFMGSNTWRKPLKNNLPFQFQNVVVYMQCFVCEPNPAFGGHEVKRMQQGCEENTTVNAAVNGAVPLSSLMAAFLGDRRALRWQRVPIATCA